MITHNYATLQTQTIPITEDSLAATSVQVARLPCQNMDFSFASSGRNQENNALATIHIEDSQKYITMTVLPRLFYLPISIRTLHNKSVTRGGELALATFDKVLNINQECFHNRV